MSTPYDEGQVTAFIDDVAQAYVDAEQAWNTYSAVWVARMQFDAIGMGYPAARSKQLDLLKKQLAGVPPQPEPGPDPGPGPPGLFVPAPREWVGQMCGVHIPELPAIYWGPPDPTLALSWLYDRYAPEHRALIREEWHRRGYTHVVLSWPDARAFGHTPQSFTNIVVELVNDGFYPCVFWCSKDFDAPDVDAILSGIDEPIRLLTNILPLACIGWELSLWLSPTQVQELTNAIAPRFTSYGARVYVHFQQGYSSFQQPGKFFADYWKANVGLLTGVLHQKILGQTPEEYRGDSGGLRDVLDRFAGNYFCPSDSGFGHPFDLIAWEVTAMTQFEGSVSEAQGDAWGTWALKTPGSSGPAGVVSVKGVGNGRLDAANTTAKLAPFTRMTGKRVDWRKTVGRLVDLNAAG